MTEQDFLKQVTNNGNKDVIALFLQILEETGSRYCIIGGIGVNAYVEPVVSLDLDIVVATRDLEKLTEKSKRHFRIKRFKHSVNLESAQSDLRIQLQTDKRYESFVENSTQKQVLGYKMMVASIENVLQGKIWAYSAEAPRPSKRQKDLADILRMIESYPELGVLVPQKIKDRFQ